MPQVGSVRIGDDVEIGANTTIDRGAIDDTVVEDGVKLDNQIQVGHNVVIGAHTAIAACTGISGSTVIGQRCMIGGMVGFAGHLTIADDVVVTGLQLGERLDQEARQLLERHADRGDETVAADGRPFAATGWIGEIMSESDRLDIAAIMRQLPHRYPFLLVDRVLECVAGQHCVALKNVTVNEPFFQGHFPHRPVMPGVLIIEALAQAAGILAFKTAKVVPDVNTRFYFVAIDNARFRKPVEPGDQLMLQGRAEARLQGNLEIRLPGARSTARKWRRRKSWSRPRPRRPQRHAGAAG